MPFHFFGGTEKPLLFKARARSSNLQVEDPVHCMLRPDRLHRLATGGFLDHAIGKPGPEYEFDIDFAKISPCSDKNSCPVVVRVINTSFESAAHFRSG